CIDAATATGAPTTDKDGLSRGTSPDIGAHEYGGTSSSSGTAPTSTLSSTPDAPNGENGWYRTAPAISIVSDGSSTRRAQWDTTASSGWIVNPGTLVAPEGRHTLYYYSTGSSGVAEAVRSCAFSTDTKSPDAPIVVSSTHPEPLRSYSTRDLALSWSGRDGASGVSGYAVAIDRNQSSSLAGAAETTKTSASYSGLEDGCWYFHARARDHAGNWGPVAHFPVNIDTVPPLPSTLFEPLAGDGAIALGWASASGDVTASRVFRSTEAFASSPEGGTNQVAAYEGNRSSYVDSGLVNGSVYYYTVFACDGAGNWSMPATILALPEKGLQAYQTALAFSTNRSRLNYGQIALLSGRLAVQTPARGIETAVVPVRIERRTPGEKTWTTLTTVHTGADGAFSYSFKPYSNAEYRAVWAGEQPLFAGTSSRILAVKVRPQVSLAASRYYARLGATVYLGGGIAPSRPGHRLLLYKKTGAGWARVSWLTANRSSRYRIRWRGTARGNHYFRVFFYPDRLHDAAYSRYIRITIR
ncbi:MAG: hypothetical protein C4521_09695, partial [Actinobacteria bacterium]